MQVQLRQALRDIIQNLETYGDKAVTEATRLCSLDERSQRAALGALLKGLEGRLKFLQSFAQPVAFLPESQVHLNLVGMQACQKLQAMIDQLRQILDNIPVAA